MASTNRSAATSSVETASAQENVADPSTVDGEGRLERMDAAAGRTTAADNAENQPEAAFRDVDPAAAEDAVVEGDTLDRDAEAAAGDPVEVVRYNGFSFEQRGFTSADLAAIGYPDQEDIWWSQENGHSVPRSRLDFLSPEDFDRLVTRDPKFTVETV